MQIYTYFPNIQINISLKGLERGLIMAGNSYRYYVLDFLVHPVAEEGEVALKRVVGEYFQHLLC